jgi:hypothetical protein
MQVLLLEKQNSIGSARPASGEAGQQNKKKEAEFNKFSLFFYLKYIKVSI